MNTAGSVSFTGALVLAVLVLTACAEVDADSDLASLRHQLVEIEKLTVPDMDRYLAFFADDLVLMPPDRPAIHGKVDAKDFYDSAFSGISSFVIDYSEPEIDISGELAVRRYTAVVEIQYPDNEVVVMNKYIDVLKKTDDGLWKIKIHAWGSNQ